MNVAAECSARRRGAIAWTFRAIPSIRSGQDKPQLFPTAHSRCRRQPCCLVVDSPLGPAVEQLVEHDPAFQPRQVRPEAVVHTLAEVMCEMLSRRMLKVSGSWYLRG